MAKGKLPLDYIRDYLHLRPRTYTIEAVARVRSALAFATHRFFQERGFHYVHTPIVTASDCEGAGEMFQVSTGGLPGYGPSRAVLLVWQSCWCIADLVAVQAFIVYRA